VFFTTEFFANSTGQAVRRLRAPFASAFWRYAAALLILWMLHQLGHLPGE
jgi:hypothetical protein